MTKTIASVNTAELFELKVKAAKDADAAKAAECLLEGYREGWLKAAGQGGTNLGNARDGRGRIACELLAKIPKYSALPMTTHFLLLEIVRAWIATEDEGLERSFADGFVFARLQGFPELLAQELKNTGHKTTEKACRIFGRMSILQINHNLSLRVLGEMFGSARPEHLIAMGQILATGLITPYFVEFELPTLLDSLKKKSV